MALKRKRETLGSSRRKVQSLWIQTINGGFIWCLRNNGPFRAWKIRGCSNLMLLRNVVFLKLKSGERVGRELRPSSLISTNGKAWLKEIFDPINNFWIFFCIHRVDPSVRQISLASPFTSYSYLIVVTENGSKEAGFQRVVERRLYNSVTEFAKPFSFKFEGSLRSFFLGCHPPLSFSLTSSYFASPSSYHHTLNNLDEKCTPGIWKESWKQLSIYLSRKKWDPPGSIT